MVAFLELIKNPGLIGFVIFAVLYFSFVSVIRARLLKKTRSKVMKHNIVVYTNIIGYLVIIIGLLGLIFYLTGNLLAFGVTAGLFTAALGWALQRPITGMAAWIMVIIKKPFRIGDRILIGGVKGDVIDITLTHIYLKEVGGTVNSEEISGRFVMIPNSVMFEQNIINYTVQDEFILDNVAVAVSYESNLDKAMKICQEVGEKILSDYLDKSPVKPYVRINFQGSGVDVHTRYYVKALERIRISSEITHEIFKRFEKEKDIEIAYPHTEVVLRQKTEKKVK